MKAETHKEEGTQKWERSSQDSMGKINHFGAELLGLCCLYNMVICNGMEKWPKSGGITCKRYNGQSVVDYVICSQDYVAKIINFEIEDCPMELKSDHNPIFISVATHFKDQHFVPKPLQKRKIILTGRVLMTQENHNTFQNSLIRMSRAPGVHHEFDKQHFMDKDNLVLTIIKALEECKRSRATREAKNTFPANPWFDEECKRAKRNWKKNMNRESRKEYDQLIKKKKEEYVNRRRIELINLGKSSPRKFWKELQ